MTALRADRSTWVSAAAAAAVLTGGSELQRPCRRRIAEDPQLRVLSSQAQSAVA